jgi:Fe-S-cluster containining protein
VMAPGTSCAVAECAKVSTSIAMQSSERPDPVVDPLALFRSLHRVFCGWLARNRHELIESVSQEAFESFDRSIEKRRSHSTSIACHGGCASCCTIRVTATAPEVLSIARYIRSSPKTMEFELRRRIERSDEVTRLLDETQRMEQGIACPFVDGDLCVVYSVRPLDCRGHASYDVQACIDALAGRACEVPISVEHLRARSLVQNAMQSALRDYGYAWALYELNQALQIGLSDDGAESAWMNGVDIFASARVSDVSSEEMAATFDAIKGCSW